MTGQPNPKRPSHDVVQAKLDAEDEQEQAAYQKIWWELEQDTEWQCRTRKEQAIEAMRRLNKMKEGKDED